MVTNVLMSQTKEDTMEHVWYSVEALKRNDDTSISGYVWWDGLSDLNAVHAEPDLDSECVGYLSSRDTLIKRERI